MEATHELNTQLSRGDSASWEGVASDVWERSMLGLGLGLSFTLASTSTPGEDQLRGGRTQLKWERTEFIQSFDARGGGVIEVEGEKGKDTNGLHREGSDRDENTLLASKLGLLQCAPVMTSIKRLVEYAHDEKFSPQSAASALNLRDVDDLYRLDLKEIYSAHMSSPFMIVDPKKLSSLINATVSHDMRNPTNSIQA